MKLDLKVTYIRKRRNFVEFVVWSCEDFSSVILVFSMSISPQHKQMETFLSSIDPDKRGFQIS